jgi:hypothetical protein
MLSIGILDVIMIRSYVIFYLIFYLNFIEPDFLLSFGFKIMSLSYLNSFNYYYNEELKAVFI